MVEYKRFLCSVSSFSKNWNLFFDLKHINAECSYTVFGTAVRIFWVY